jgi:hypothetical protein
MGVIILDTISVPFMTNLSNTYAAFGRTNASVFCTFDASNNRQYVVGVPYGLYYNKEAYYNGLKPLQSIQLNLIGNVGTVSNIYQFITQGIIDRYTDVVDDGIEN